MMLKKWLSLLGIFIVIGFVGGGAFSRSQPATQNDQGKLPKNYGKVVVHYVYGKKGHPANDLWSSQTLTGRIGTHYQTKAEDLLNQEGYMVLAGHSKNTAGTFKRHVTHVTYTYWDYSEIEHEFKHGADLMLDVTADHRIGLFDRNLQDGVEVVMERPNFAKPYYDVTFSTRNDTNHGSGLKSYRYRFGTTTRFKDPRNGNIYTTTLTPKGGITFKAVATKHSTMNELVIVNDRVKLVTAKIK